MVRRAFTTYRQVKLKILDTERLTLREFTPDDAAFVLELINEPGWLQNIGDKGIRTLEGAQKYVEASLLASYAKHGFGLYAVELRGGGAAVGMCGLVKRDSLDDVDIGFAFLARHSGRGYAQESGAAILAHALDVLKLPRVVGITAPGNKASMRVLEKIGLRYVDTRQLRGEQRDSTYFTSDA